MIDIVMATTDPPSAFSVFDTDTEEVLIDEAADLAPWIGDGQIMLGAMTQFQIDLDPPDEIEFSAGGTVRCTETYDFAVLLSGTE